MFSNQKGQTLLELVVVIAVGVVVIGALTFATISTMRNASFSKNLSQATKLGQEALERARVIRDRQMAGTITNFRMGANDGTDGDNLVSSWSDPDMWDFSALASCPAGCYFSIASDGALNSVAGLPTIATVNGFKTAIVITDTAATSAIEKIVTAIVTWNDFAGPHESRQTTILRKIQ